jgi:DNA polymerase I-like protein with 3'-5' exonuclease and polymerase domains
VVLSWEEAQTIVSEFFAMFPELRAWQNRQKRMMRKGMTITSPLGRQWQIPADDWHQINEGLNAPIQATSSDLMLLGLNRAWPLIEAQGRLVNIVHDSIDVVIAKGTFNDAAWRAIASVIAGVDPRFPMMIDVAVGPSWGETKERFTVGGAS